MARFIKGELISIPFPFSDLTKIKKRPALIIAVLAQGDYLVCQVTSKDRAADENSIEYSSDDIVSGGLPVDGYIRVDKILTINEDRVEESKGLLSENKMNEVIEKIKSLVSK